MIRVNLMIRGQVLIIALSVASSTFAADRKSDWIEGMEKGDGATRDYYNRAARLEWENLMGDWRDAKGGAQGYAAYAVARVDDTDSGRFVGWDVTGLVREWQSGKVSNKGFFLRIVGGRGKIDFCARDYSDHGLRPELVVSAAGETKTLRANADTHLVKSTYQSHGKAELLRVSGEDHALVRFDLASAPRVSKATLRLYTTRQYGGADIGVFRVWMNIYHGGKKPSPYDQHVFIDNVVIAREYVGPLSE
jgi:hypothetical protein